MKTNSPVGVRGKLAAVDENGDKGRAFQKNHI
jgi:hypothetical protein